MSSSASTWACFIRSPRAVGVNKKVVHNALLVHVLLIHPCIYLNGVSGGRSAKHGEPTQAATARRKRLWHCSVVGATARTPARLGNGRLTYSRLGDDLRGARLRGHELLNTTTTLHDFQLVRGEDRVIMWRLSPQSSKRCGSSRSSPSLPLSQRVSQRLAPCRRFRFPKESPKYESTWN